MDANAYLAATAYGQGLPQNAHAQQQQQQHQSVSPTGSAGSGVAAAQLQQQQQQHQMQLAAGNTQSIPISGMVPSTPRVLYWGSGSPPAWRVLTSLHEKGLSFRCALYTPGTVRSRNIRSSARGGRR